MAGDILSSSLICYVFAVAFSIYWASKELLKSTPKATTTARILLSFPLSPADAVLTPIYITLVANLFLHVVLNSGDDFGKHALNALFILSISAAMQVIRLKSIKIRLTQQHYQSKLNVLHVGILNAFGMVLVYCAVFYETVAGTVLACFMLLLNLVKTVKYRIFDDFNPSQSDRGSIVFTDAFYVIILDILLRMIVSLILTYAFACLLLLANPSVSGAAEYEVSFAINNPSDNLFVDFLYFATVSLTTVGFGDISPVSELAKITSTVFIVIGYIVFASIIGLSITLVMAFRENSAVPLKFQRSKRDRQD